MVLLALFVCSYVGQICENECLWIGYVLPWASLQRKLHCQYSVFGREKVNHQVNYCVTDFLKAIFLADCKLPGHFLFCLCFIHFLKFLFKSLTIDQF